MNKLLRGIYDLHVHAAPDVVPRKCDDLELACRLTDAGMAGCCIKCHFAETAARAALLQAQFPTLRIAGGIALNRAVGGLNPHAVERCGQLGGKFVWFPTLEARAFQCYRHSSEPEADLSDYLAVCGEDGRLLPAALEVLDAAAENRMVIATGHIGAEEGMALVKAGADRGLQMVLTHADNPANAYSVEQQRQAVALGALVEHSFFTTYYDRTSIGEITRQIRAVGCENVLLTTDFGQPDSPYADEGMTQYGTLLLRQGFTLDEWRVMTRDNPSRLLR